MVKHKTSNTKRQIGIRKSWIINNVFNRQVNAMLFVFFNQTHVVGKMSICLIKKEPPIKISVVMQWHLDNLASIDLSIRSANVFMFMHEYSIQYIFLLPLERQ